MVYENRQTSLKENMKRVHLNIMANYASRLWGIISVFVFVPIYIRLLGIESYGILGFQTVILTFLYMADAGLGASFTRETARSEDKAYLGDLLYSLERVYLSICTFLIIGMILLAPVISGHWLRADKIPHASLTCYIAMIGICVPLQVFINLYSGGLMGLQKQTTANGLQISFSMVRSGLVIIPLTLSPNLFTYFSWQIGVTLLFLCLYRRTTWRAIYSARKPSFRWPYIRAIAKFSMGMMGMAIISSLNTQIDKVVVSKMLALKDFAHYALAAMLAQAPSLMVLPIAVAVLPQLVRLSEKKSRTELLGVYQTYSFVIAALASMIGLLLFFFPFEIVFMWTRNQELAYSIQHVVRILALGDVFLSFQVMPYHLAIAHGHNLTSLRLGIVCAICMVPAMVLCIHLMGVAGAAFPWLTMNFVGFLVLGFLLMRKFLPGDFWQWFFRTNVVPLVICFGLGSFAKMIPVRSPMNRFSGMIIPTITGLVMVLVLGAVFKLVYLFPGDCAGMRRKDINE